MLGVSQTGVLFGAIIVGGYILIGVVIYLLLKLLLHFSTFVSLTISSAAVGFIFWYFEFRPYHYLFLFLALVFLVWEIVRVVKKKK